MSIISFPFFVFTALTVLLYYLFPLRLRWTVLAAASAAFVLIGTKNPFMYAIFVLMTLLTWRGALMISQTENVKIKNRVTAVCIMIPAAVLILFKENSFFINNINHIGRLFGMNFGFRPPEWSFPFGISYFTLILIGYLLDVRWGLIEHPQENPWKMLVFAGYFPHLASGPFTRYNEIQERLYAGNHFDYDNFCFGLQRFLWGLFKKLVIADNLAPLVAGMYDAQPSLITVIAGGWLYVLQLYTDFSGCMDIVIGCSQLFGIPLAENFRTPFYSVSLSEWWRRWHITLGLWLRDYIMYPLQKILTAKIGSQMKKRFGKKAGKRIVLYFSMLVLWFCVGFWHGGSWKYIVSSGLAFFVLIVGGMILEPYFLKLADFLHVNRNCWSWVMFQRIRTFLLFSLPVSLGRTPSFSAGVSRFVEGLTHWRIGQDLRLFINWLKAAKTERLSVLLLMTVSFVALFVVSLLENHYGDVRKLLAKQNLVFRWGVLILLLFVTLICGAYGGEFSAGAFIYQGF